MKRRLNRQVVMLEVRYDPVDTDQPVRWDWASMADELPENVKVVWGFDMPPVETGDDDG